MPEDKSAVNYREFVYTTVQSYGLTCKVFMYRTDNENTMKAAFSKEEKWLLCTHRIQGEQESVG